MIRTVNKRGVKARVRNTKFNFFTVAILATFLIILTGCPKTPNGEDSPSGNETAATVNGTAIKLEEVERAIKQQAQGQESKLSQLELAQARLQVLEKLIQNEVLYQKASNEDTIPKDEDVTTELNKMKTGSGMSKDEFEKRMKEAGVTEEILHDQVKKQIAIQKLVENVTGKVESPTDSEIEAFYNGNKEAFKKKRGVKLAAIVVDPRDSGNGDTTTDEASTKIRLEEISKKLQGGADFAAIATELSEDPSRLRKGDLGYISEDQMKQTFSPEIASAFMNAKRFPIGQPLGPFNISGKLYIFKIQERNEKDEDETLETDGVKQRITDTLINARKQLLNASYAAIAMNEATIVNYLAQNVVENPNELSGARPAPTVDDKKDDKAEDDKKDEKSDDKSDDKSDADKESKTDKKEEDKK